MPKRSPCVQIASAQPARHALISAGRASVVKSKSGRRRCVADQQVADRAADEVQPVAGRGEPLGEWGELVEDRPETIRDHNQPCCCQWSRSRHRPRREPGPADVGRSTSPGVRTAATSRHSGELAHHLGRAVGQRVEVVAALEHHQRPPRGHQREHAPRSAAHSRRRPEPELGERDRRGGRRSRPRR